MMLNRDKLILDNMKLINNVIRKYYKECTVDEEDLKQYGTIGLIKAVDDYINKDELRNKYQLSTIATKRILTEIKRGIAYSGEVVGNRETRLKFSNSNQIPLSYFQQENQKSNGEFQVELQEYQKLKEDKLKLDNVTNQLETISLKECINKLSKTKKDILNLSLYGYTDEEIGKHYNMSKRRINQIKIMAQNDIKNIIKDKNFISRDITTEKKKRERTKKEDKLYPNLQKEFQNICKERKLARKYIVKEIGIADLTIQKWFNGTRVPSETMQDKVCKYFNKNKEYLFKVVDK